MNSTYMLDVLSFLSSDISHYTSEDISPNLYICILCYRPWSSMASINFVDKTFENYGY